ncbi:tmcA [Symbiodinium natans]|uniref:TmcA protein n=1 Tax=Symbiodinium natans TaxID=878477 RepID=A0A812N4J0_9DINO|nr:tmcA [Symbiodinium natans]
MVLLIPSAVGKMDLIFAESCPVLVVDEMASLPIPELHQLLVSRVPLILKVFKELGADSAEVCRHATLPEGIAEREFVKLSLQVDYDKLGAGSWGKKAVRVEVLWCLKSLALEEDPGLTRSTLLHFAFWPEAVRYKPGDPVESWLDSLLFLDVVGDMPQPPSDPKDYGSLRAARFVEVDAARSTDPLVMGLLRGHYRTSPNDLTRLVTDPHIRTFALVAKENQGPPAVVVVAIEETPERLGQSGAKVHQTHLLANGPSLSMRVEKEYPFLALARLRGLRPWRVVAAPAARGQGFGQRAIELLADWAKGTGSDGSGEPRFDWLGVSFGLTAQLFRFWSRAGYRPVVMSNTPNDQTGEMSMKMLLPISAALARAVPSVLPLFGTSFFRRLPTCFRDLDTQLVLDILTESGPAGDAWHPPALEAARLEKFAAARKPVEEAARIYDIFPRLASAYFVGGLKALDLSGHRAEVQPPGSVSPTLKELSLHIGAVDVECLLTVAPREQVLLERSQAHHAAQAWLPSLVELWDGKEVCMELPEPSEAVGGDPTLVELANYAIHDLNVQEPHFSLLMSGEKRIELRLAKRRFCCVEPGAYFRVQKASPPQQALFRILRADRYDSVAEALRCEGVGCVLPGVTSADAGLAAFAQLYGPQGLGEGVIAFELELAKKEAPQRPTSPPILPQRAAARSEQSLSITARWQYPCPAKAR